MKLSLLCIGRLSIPWLRDGAQDYIGRLGRYLPVTVDELKDVKQGGKKSDNRRIIAQESAQLLARLAPGAYTVALDEKGKLFHSEELAKLLESHMIDGTPEIAFMIGGPYGLSDDVRARADLVLSLSPMTLTHQMARVLLLEQLYRGMTILRNEPYHNR